MIPKDQLIEGRWYIGVHNRLNHWHEARMRWDGDYFSEKSDGMWPSSPFEYYNRDSRFATFLPIEEVTE